MSFDNSLKCREKHHESELLTSFCEQCKVCICDKCGKTRHSNHTKVDIDQAAKECKVNIEEIAEEMKKQVADFQIQVERSKERTRKTREEISAARNKALTSLEELIQLLKKHESTTMTNLNLQEETELRGHATQLEHFQTSISKLQKSVEYCEAVLQRNESIEILQVHQPLVERYRGLLDVEKQNIDKPMHTALHARYEIDDELVKTLRCAVPGRLVVSNTDHLQSVAEGKGLKEADVGKEANFVITTKDSNQKQCYNEDDQIIVKVETLSGLELNRNITPREDGEYSVTYTPDCVGQHGVVIEVNGQPLTGSPWSLHVSPDHYRRLYSFGSYGIAQGQFHYPCDIAIDENTGNIAVADLYNSTVQLFSSEGEHLNTMSGKEIIKPTSVAFTRSSNLIVISSGKIFCFNECGEVGKNITRKHLKKPFRLTIARDGRMVVCDKGDNTVKVLSPDGTQLLLIISAPDHAEPFSAVSHQDMFVVCYHSADRVQVFGEDGVFLYGIGSFGSGDGQMWGPTGLSVDLSSSNLVVCDQLNRRIQIFTLDGDLVRKIEAQHAGLVVPYSVAVSPTGQLYITDTGKYCIHVIPVKEFDFN